MPWAMRAGLGRAASLRGDSVRVAAETLVAVRWIWRAAAAAMAAGFGGSLAADGVLVVVGGAENGVCGVVVVYVFASVG